MKSNPLTASIVPVELKGWIVCAAFAAAAVIGISLFVGSLINAPAARAKIERQNAEEITQENRTICTRFGMPPNTPAFNICADGLAQVRQRQEDRWKRDFDMF